MSDLSRRQSLFANGKAYKIFCSFFYFQISLKNNCVPFRSKILAEKNVKRAPDVSSVFAGVQEVKCGTKIPKFVKLAQK